MPARSRSACNQSLVMTDPSISAVGPGPSPSTWVGDRIEWDHDFASVGVLMMWTACQALSPVAHKPSSIVTITRLSARDCSPETTKLHLAVQPLSLCILPGLDSNQARGGAERKPFSGQLQVLGQADLRHRQAALRPARHHAHRYENRSPATRQQRSRTAVSRPMPSAARKRRTVCPQ